MAQGKTRHKKATGKGSKGAKRKRKNQQRKERQKRTFAKLPKFKKKQISNQMLTRSINNKNHDLAVSVAMANGEPLRMVSSTKQTHTRKFKVKQ